MTILDDTDKPLHGSERPRRRGAGLLILVATLIVVAGVSMALGQLGTNGIYVLGCVVALSFLIWSVRDLVLPPVVDAVHRVRPKPIDVEAFGRLRTLLGAGMAAVAAGVLAFAIAGAGTKVVYGIIALLLLAVGLWLLWPAILLLMDTPSDGQESGVSAKRSSSKEIQWTAMGLARDSVPRTKASGSARAVGTCLAVVAAGMVAFLSAGLGSKALLVLVGVIIVVACLVRARDKTLFAVFGSVCALAFLEHKSFGTVNLTIAGGAPSVYVTSFDAMLLLLYAIWVSEGTFITDVRAALPRRIVWVPLIGVALMLPSLFAHGASVALGVSELVRMSWMFLLFFYVAVRVRSRAMVWAILGGFATFAVVEIVVVLLQWKTGGVLGLSFLGVPTHLNKRITDTSALGRPFGTIIHPDFMGAAMGSLGLLALALGLTLRRSLTKIVALVLSVGCILCLYLAHTRAALVGLVLVLFGMVAAAIVHRHVQWRTIGKVAVVLLVAAVAFFPQIQTQITNNFGTSHFGEEITSRYQLNDVAGEMFDDHPLIGVGLNSFQPAMGPYEQKGGVIFIDNPVQNLYLLYLSETGILGMAGFLVVGIALYNVALRLARSRDRLYGGVGLGVSAAMAFLMIEELLTFSLREDVPLAVYWIFAGLAVACYRLAGMEGRRRPRRLSPEERAARMDDLRQAVNAIPEGCERPKNANGQAVLAQREDAAGNRLARRVRRRTQRSLLAYRRQRRAERRVDQLLLPVESDEVHSISGQDDAGPPRAPALSTTGSHGRHVIRSRTLTRRRRLGLTMLVATLVVGTLIAAGVHGRSGAQASGPPSATASSAVAAAAVPIAQMRVVFAGHSSTLPNSPSFNGIFVANGDGSGLHALVESPTQTTTVYNWPQWALGGTKIIFTERNGPATSPTDPLGTYENIWEMNPDGSNIRQLTNYKYRVVQPKVSADGQSVLFTGQNPQFPEDAVYKLNLLTLQATNLSQVTQPNGSVDADPKWTPDGNIVLAATEAGVIGEAIDEFNADGTDRRVLVNDGNFNTDPEMSPDGSEVAYSAFYGPNPAATNQTSDQTNPDDNQLNPANWHVDVRNLSTGAVTSLTHGESCLSATITCAPDESSGWKPVWSPDGSTIAWTGRLNVTTTCICAANADGSDPRVLIKSDDIVIDWFDWTAPTGHVPATAVLDSQIGTTEPTTRLLISGNNGTDSSVTNQPLDMMSNDGAGTGTATNPSGASWNADRSEFVFVGNVDYDADNPQYGPPPPPGQQVHEHFTLQELNPLLPRFSAGNIPATEQVFLHKADGTIEQLTTPWIEDWRDALDSGDARANTDPVLSPNGQYVVFTNHSTLTGESFLLSLNLTTGSVVNLTNGTAGAMQVNDGLPQWSPDSTEIAFTWTEGSTTEVSVMNASDGTSVTSMTDDNAFDTDPTWSPDGKSIVYSHYDGSIQPTAAQLESLIDLPRSGWSLVKVDVATGHETVLTTPDESPTWRPVFSPDGSHIDFIGWQYATTDIFDISADGGTVNPLLITPLMDETSVDWR